MMNFHIAAEEPGSGQTPDRVIWYRFLQPNPQKTLRVEAIPNLVFGLLVTEIMQLL
jgi:hypothetical protein